MAFQELYRRVMQRSLHMGSATERKAAVALIATALRDKEGQVQDGWDSSVAHVVDGLVKCMRMPGQQHRPLHASAANLLTAIMFSKYGVHVQSGLVQEMKDAAEKLCEDDTGKARVEAQLLINTLAQGGNTEESTAMKD
jgi:hypothetical protein